MSSEFAYKAININSANKINSRLHYIILLTHLSKFTENCKETTSLSFHESSLQAPNATQNLYWKVAPSNGWLGLFIHCGFLPSHRTVLKPSHFRIKPLQNDRLLQSWKFWANHWNWECQIQECQQSTIIHNHKCAMITTIWKRGHIANAAWKHKKDHLVWVKEF